MGLFDKLFRKQKNVKEENVVMNVSRSEKVKEIMRLQDIMHDILSRKEFVAKSEYLSLIPSYSRMVEYFNVLIDSGSIENYCRENGISVSDVEEICQMYGNIEK